jgi:hypothetical protein
MPARRTLFLAGLLLLPVLAACGEDDEPSRGVPDVRSTSAGIAGSFVGTLEGTDAFIALVVLDSREALAYVCDGKGVSQWFRGMADASTLNVSSDTGQLEAALSHKKASGEVTLADGKTATFSAEPARGASGLYRATGSGSGESLVGGWIVLNDGEQRGSVEVRKSGDSQTLVLGTLLASVDDAASEQEALLVKLATQNAQAEELSDQIGTLVAAARPTPTPIPAVPMTVRGVVLHPLKLSSSSISANLN